MTLFVSSIFFSFDDGDFDDAEEDEGLDDLENVEDVRWDQHVNVTMSRWNTIKWNTALV